MISEDSFSINSPRSFHLSLDHKRMLFKLWPKQNFEGDHSVLNNVYILDNARNIFYFIYLVIMENACLILYSLTILYVYKMSACELIEEKSDTELLNQLHVGMV